MSKSHKARGHQATKETDSSNQKASKHQNQQEPKYRKSAKKVQYMFLPVTVMFLSVSVIVLTGNYPY
jgi:hypothetical protein